MSNIVILGCGFAGLEAALWLERIATADMNIVVINNGGSMVYTPSLIWVPPQRRALGEISIELEPVLSRKGIEFLQIEAIAIEPDRNIVVLSDGQGIRYD